MTVTTSAAMTVPSFYCPIPARCHPEADRLDASTAEWIRAYSLFADDGHRAALGAARIGRLVALTAPRGASERMAVVADLNGWYHSLDDYWGDARLGGQTLSAVADLVARLTHELESPRPPRPGAGIGLPVQDRFVLALRDVVARVAAVATPAQLEDWLRGVQTYLTYELWETVNRHAARTPSLEQYALHCVSGRAARASMVMLPIVGAYEVPPSEARGEVLRALTQMACLIACWDNDIYSYPKEAAQPGGEHNLLKVLAAVDGREPMETVGEAVAMRDRVMSRFLWLRTAAEPALSAGGRRYAEDLGLWIAGQIAWGTASARFARMRFDVVMPTALAPAARDAGTEPLPVDALHWWWQVAV